MSVKYNIEVTDWDTERTKDLGGKVSLNLQYEHLGVKSSQNLSENEDSRRLAGKIWNPNLSWYNGKKSKGYCPC